MLFVNALKPSIDGAINIGSVDKKKKEKKTFLQKVFGKKDGDKKDNKKDEKDSKKKAKEEKHEKRKKSR